ncbi:hypothetical protein [uncultured Flavobacterium sp.]|uniref:hypothetical protein n=1 Tax=uncultured Flavobacterium sp. TaxID=165435 RepID=UPI0025D2FBD5|nr:hypothetical protein [uncultured Flavobacterium sp.]
MEKLNYIIFCTLNIILLNNCANDRLDSTEIYNQKANEIIFQIIKESGCNCLLEIPNESMIETSNAENPSYDIRNFLVEKLNTKNNSNLDSLVRISKNFHLDVQTVKKNEIKIITLGNLQDINKDDHKKFLKMCPNGIITFRKPIFDKKYQKAVLDFNYAFNCVKILPLPIYEYKNGKWKHR